MLAFEWDDDKARSNLAKHGVSFRDAAQAFGDPLLMELEPQVAQDGEIRFAILGDSRGNILFVGYVERRRALRIITARRATKDERKRYEEGWRH